MLNYLNCSLNPHPTLYFIDPRPCNLLPTDLSEVPNTLRRHTLPNHDQLVKYDQLMECLMRTFLFYFIFIKLYNLNA